MSKTILFLGGGKDSIGIIDRARQMGLTVAVMDYDHSCPGRRLADYFIWASCYDIDEAIEGTELLFSQFGIMIDGVMCAGTDAPDVAAAIADKYGLPGLSPRAAAISKDKIAQAHVFGLYFYKINTPNHTLGLLSARDLRKPIVVKPANSRGARGVSRVTRRGLLLAWWRARRYSKSVIVQEWIDGVQLSSESIIIDGEVKWTAFAERNYSRLDEFAPYVIEDGSDMPPAAHGFEDKANVELQKCATVLGIKNGTLKGDLVWDGENIWVIEVAARLSGGLFCSDMIPGCWGIDFVGNAIRLALGEKPWKFAPRFRKYVCQRFAFPRRPTCHPERGEGVIAFGNSREDARMKAERMLRDG